MTVSYQNTLAVENELARGMLIDKIDKTEVITKWANKKYEGILERQGQTVTVPVFPRLRGTRGGTAGSDITESTFSITKENLSVDQIIQDNRPVGKYEEVVSSFDLLSKVVDEQGYNIGQAKENHIAVTAIRGAVTANVLNEVTPVALASATVYQQMVNMRNALAKQDVRGREVGMFVDPATAGWLIQSDILDSSELGISRRLKPLTDAQGFLGRVGDFLVYETNNIPFKQKLSLATQVTADDTITVTLFDIEAGEDTTVTLTAKASPSAAGEFDLGGDVAATRVNIVNLINGTGTAGTSSYIELSAANRGLFNEYEVQITDFTDNVAYVTANRQITLGETFTNEADVFGTASFAIFACDKDAINFVEQLSEYKLAIAENGFRVKSLYEHIFQAKVFSENGKRIAVNHVTIV